MRLFLVGAMATGIGATLLAISIYLAHIGDITTAFYSYLGCVLCVVVVVFCAAINSLTTWAGFVHPDDRLWSNILAYLLTLFVILTYGRFISGPFTYWLLNVLFNAGSMMVLALIFLFSFVGLSGQFGLREVLEGTEAEEHAKEVSARLILFSLVVGAVMAAIQVGLVALYWNLDVTFGFGQPTAYYITAFGIGGIATILVITLGILLRSRYEPVGRPT
ncbi:MAG: hypothetical protein ACFFDP_10350 [Promethearchaeota archaeon]